MRKKKKKSDNNSEAWMLPYSDMLTLLLALFIVMFASAKIDDSKFQQISSEFGSLMALEPDKQGQSVEEAGGSAAIELATPAVSNKQKNSQKDPKNKKIAQQRENQVRGTIAQQNQEQQLKRIAKSLNQTAAQLDLGENTKATIKSDGLHLNLDSNILFNSGSAEITKTSAKALQELSPKLGQLRANQVTIAGYTDNVPQNSAQYPSNWELSAARAVAVMHFFVKQEALTESKVAIKAAGENEPRASNSTARGRAQNRRVELIIKKAP